MRPSARTDARARCCMAPAMAARLAFAASMESSGNALTACNNASRCFCASGHSSAIPPRRPAR